MSYEAWRISFQSSEAAAKAAYAEWQKSIITAALIADKWMTPEQRQFGTGGASAEIMALLAPAFERHINATEEPARVGWEE